MLEVPNTESQYIHDAGLAWEVAHAEKLGRDHLHDNPDLPRDKMIAVAYEIGAASMLAEISFYNEFDAYGLSYRPYEYRTIPKPHESLELQASPLVAEWAKLPNIKLIDGRPVVSRADMTDFERREASGGQTLQRGIGSRTWNTLRDATSDTDYEAYS